MTRDVWGLLSARGAVAGLVVLGLLGASGCGDDGEASPPEDSGVHVGETGADDLDAEVPDGWRAVPLDDLGFGLALPAAWEDVVLDADGLAILSQADPRSSGFVPAAMHAARTGAVFYAAGDQSGEGEPVNDLKVLAHLDPEVDGAPVETTADLQAFSDLRAEATELAEGDVRVDPVGDWTYPAVDLRLQARFGPDGGDEMVSEVVERLVLAPSGVVFSVIVTGDDAGEVDDLAGELFTTLGFS